AFIGDPGHCSGSCDFEYPGQSPNGDDDGDRMINTIWHESAEAIACTGSVYDPENADLCENYRADESYSDPAVGYVQHDFTYTIPGTSLVANQKLGTMSFLLQPMWQNVHGGGCVRRLGLTKPSHETGWSYALGDMDGDFAPDLVTRDSSSGTV